MRTALLVLVSVLCGAVTYGARTAATAHYFATQQYEDVYYVPPPEWLPVFSAGYDEALADVLWMRALVYFGDEVRHRGEVAHVFDYADAILTLDPAFRHAYRWVGTASIYRTGTVDPEDVRRAVSYLERGSRAFPDDGEMAWDYGATLLYELVPVLEDAAEKDHYRQLAVEPLETAARKGAGPAWLALTNATQLRRLGRTEQAVRHLEEMYATVQDPDTREQIGLQLENLRSRAYAEALAHANQELETNRMRDYPYLDTALYLLVGERIAFDAVEAGLSPETREEEDGATSDGPSATTDPSSDAGTGQDGNPSAADAPEPTEASPAR